MSTEYRGGLGGVLPAGGAQLAGGTQLAGGSTCQAAPGRGCCPSLLSAAHTHGVWFPDARVNPSTPKLPQVRGSDRENGQVGGGRGFPALLGFVPEVTQKEEPVKGGFAPV